MVITVAETSKLFPLSSKHSVSLWVLVSAVLDEHSHCQPQQNPLKGFFTFVLLCNRSLVMEHLLRTYHSVPDTASMQNTM